MTNKVFLEGIVTRSSWGRNKETGGYFINIKQERVFNKYRDISIFQAFANRPLAGELAKIVEANPECRIMIEGKLKTYYSKNDGLYHTTVHIEKLLNWMPASKAGEVAVQPAETKVEETK